MGSPLLPGPGEDTALSGSSASLCICTVAWATKGMPHGTMDRLVAAAERNQSHLLIGVTHLNGTQGAWNSLLHLAPGSTRLSFHGKHGLMPFGEFTPAGFEWFSRRTSIAQKSLSPAPAQQPPFVVKSVPLAPLICYEDWSGALARARARDAAILINPSNMAWFEGSAGIAQGLAIARMRALESGRPLLRVTNAAGSAHIDHRGRIAARAHSGEATLLTGRIQPMTGLTPYVRAGDLPALLLCAAVVLGAVRFAVRDGKARACGGQPSHPPTRAY